MFGGGWWVQQLVDAGEHVRLISWIFWVIFSICLHELGHGWAALWQGDDTPRRMGHMNMNPLVHMGPVALIVFALIGITWGMMPVDPSRFRSGRLGDLYVSAAGPAMNFLLALGCMIVLVVLGILNLEANFAENLTLFFFIGAWINVVLGLFNLIPAPPLDGSRMLAAVNRPFARLIEHPNAVFIGLFILIVLLWTGVISIIFTASSTAVQSTVAFGVQLLGGGG